MGLDRIKYLEDKFWKGECSEKEEMELSKLLISIEPNYPVEHSDLKDYLSIGKAKKHSLGADFDEKILSQLSVVKTKAHVYQWMTIAASLMILISLSIIYIKKSQTTSVYANIEDTYNNPEDAFKAVQEALKLVSGGINEGVQYGAVLSEFENTTSTIKNL